MMFWLTLPCPRGNPLQKLAVPFITGNTCKQSPPVHPNTAQSTRNEFSKTGKWNCGFFKVVSKAVLSCFEGIKLKHKGMFCRWCFKPLFKCGGFPEREEKKNKKPFCVIIYLSWVFPFIAVVAECYARWLWLFQEGHHWDWQTDNLTSHRETHCMWRSICCVSLGLITSHCRNYPSGESAWLYICKHSWRTFPSTFFYKCQRQTLWAISSSKSCISKATFRPNLGIQGVT